MCKVEGMNNYSLGKMNDVKYFPESEELRVRYLEVYCRIRTIKGSVYENENGTRDDPINHI